MEDKIYGNRTRVSFKQSTKDKITCEVTFEGIDMEREEVIKEAKDLLEKAMSIAEERSVLK